MHRAEDKYCEGYISHPSGYFKEKNISYYFWASKNIQWVHVPAFYMRQILRLSAIGAASPQIV